MEIKSGFKTSEFYLTLIPTVGAMLVLTGVIPENDSAQVVNLIKDAVSGIVAIVGIVSYIMGRTEIKREVIRNSKAEILG